ncbi:RNA polymerase sigma-70 factor [Rapidithrix thailandica]|uniref:RNA polymerase sigma-70 factor n=1 Tax=Rapidithrix thailandica TaxID=413964 RepID=A0AAW9SAH4_9BACT
MLFFSILKKYSPYLSNQESILIHALKKDEKAAFRQLYNLYVGKVYHFAKKFVLNPDYAQEVTQIVFIKVWESRHNINPDQSLHGYLYVITRNASFDFLKKIAKDRDLREELLDWNEVQVNETEFTVLFSEYEKLVYEAIAKLPPKRQEIFRMGRLEGKSYEEIANHLGVSKNTVKTHLLKAYRFVRQYLHNYADMIILLAMGFWL